jgi:hypothetical protein
VLIGKDEIVILTQRIGLKSEAELIGAKSIRNLPKDPGLEHLYSDCPIQNKIK